jgi:hypothetical protein
MKIKWSPQYSSKQIEYKQPEKDILYIKAKDIEIEVDFSDDTIFVYDIPEQVKRYVLDALRDEETNELKVRLLRPYSKGEKQIWENKNYYETGGFRGTQYEDYGEEEILK